MKTDSTIYCDDGDRFKVEEKPSGNIRITVHETDSALSYLTIYLSKAAAFVLWDMLGGLKLNKEGGKVNESNKG